MDENDFAAFSAAWRGAHELYGKPPADGAVDIAFDALADLSIKQVREGLTSHVRSKSGGQFPPKPADVLRHALGDDGSIAMAAWEKLRKGIRSVGNYRGAVFDDPIIHLAVVRMGGWSTVTNWSSAEIPFRQQEFERVYKDFLQMPTLPPHRGVLAGSHAKDNPDDVTLIGDPSACQKLLANASTSRGSVRTTASNLTRQLTMGAGHGS